jgi:hypothetical protein
MKKVITIVGSALVLGGLSAMYVYKVRIPSIKIESVNYDKKQVNFSVNGKKYSFVATDGLNTSAPISFSKYDLTFEPNQKNTNDVWRLFVANGEVSVGQPLYFDFKLKKQY